MIAALKPYAEYKQLGLPWLGQVPGHWDVRQARHIGRLLKGVGGTKEDSVADGLPCVRYGELYTTYKSFIRTTRTFIKPSSAPDYMPVHFGDVLFAASGEKIEEIGKSAVNLMKAPAVCGGDIIVLRPSIPIHAPYLGYAFDCHDAANQKSTMGRGTTIKHIYPDELRGLIVTLPPPAEQVSIVRFLDWANGRLGRAIRAKRKVIALLVEQKQAIIHRAVTRGLDTSVTLKPSGIPWLGDIPRHWEVVRGKRLFSPRKESALPEDVQLSATQAYGVIPQTEFEAKVDRRVVKISMHLEKRRHVERDDFVISMRSFQGGLERAWSSGAIRSSYVVLKPGSCVDVTFFAYLFKSHTYIHALQGTADFIRDGQDLNFGNFCRVDLPLIPLCEQRAIAEFIVKATIGIDSTFSRLEREIELLREYRTRLVADVVTGKLDVREASLHPPDEAPPETAEDDAELNSSPDASDEEATP